MRTPNRDDRADPERRRSPSSWWPAREPLPWRREPGEVPQGARSRPAEQVAAGLLAGLYVGLAGVDLVQLRGLTRVAMVLLSCVSSAVLVAVGSTIAREPGRVGRAQAAVAAVVTVNCAAWAVVYPHQTAVVLFGAVGISAVIESRAWGAVFVGVLVASWAAAVARATGTAPMWGHVSELALALFLGAALHQIRVRREALLAAARDDERVAREQAQLAEEIAERDRDALAASESRFRQIFTASPVPIGVADEQGRIRLANPALCGFLGRSERELLTLTTHDVSHPDDEHVVPDVSEDPAWSPPQVEKRYLRKDGSVRWGWVHVVPVPGPEGQVWALAHIQDITERKAQEHATLDDRLRARAISEITSQVRRGAQARDAVVASARLVAGADFVALLEPDDGGLVVTATSTGQQVGHRASADTDNGAQRAWHSQQPQLVKTDGDVALDGYLPCSAGSVLWQPVPRHGSSCAVLCALWERDVGDVDAEGVRAIRVLAEETGHALVQQDQLADLERRATTDSLTGICNRRAWDAQLRMLLAEFAKRGTPLSVAMLDLDHFKVFNDTFGHQAGDRLLQRFAHAAVGVIRPGDLFARWGGEEFVVALPGLDLAQAEPVVERIRRCVPSGQTCSAGLTQAEPGDGANDVVARADAALYEAKRQGRDRLRRCTGGAVPAPR